MSIKKSNYPHRHTCTTSLKKDIKKNTPIYLWSVPKILKTNTLLLTPLPLLRRIKTVFNRYIIYYL